MCFLLLLILFKDTTDFSKPTPAQPGSSTSPKHALLTRFLKQWEGFAETCLVSSILTLPYMLLGHRKPGGK